MFSKKFSVTGLVTACLTTTFLLTTGTVEAASPKENYHRFCAQCHGMTGKGDGINATDEMPVSPRNHTDAKAMGKLTSKDVYFAIKDGGKAVGKSALMPRWSDSLSDDEIKAMVKHLTELCKCSYKS